MDLRPYQQEAVDAVQSAWAECGRDPAVEIFCGLGKSLIMKRLLQELDGLRLVVMPSLSLVNQFCHDYLRDMGPYLPFCSLGECDEVMRATTQEEQVAAFLEGEPDGILVVTYKSLAKLLGFLEGREIDGALFDESHHIDERQYNFIKELQVNVAYFSATPPKNLGQTVFEFSYADALNYVDPETGESRPWSRDFRVLTAMYTDLPGDSMVETLARAIQDSGNGRVLTFHAQVNGESENSVKKFSERCAALQGLFPGRTVTTRYMDADTPMQVRAQYLQELDETPDTDVYVIHSCETISEGVDTKCCNHVFFCDAAMSYRIAIQKIGRCVRLREQRHPATVTIPACIPRDEYAALTTLEERNAYIREQYSALGKFSQLFDFIGCLRENNQELLDLVLQAHKAPGRKEHYERELDEGAGENDEEPKKEKKRFTLPQAVQRITGQPFSGDIAADADAAGRTIEVHSLENGVETHGSGAALETLVEMEPGLFIHTRRRVAPPQGNRLQFSESPFLLSLGGLGDDLGNGVGGSLRTAVLDYEVRPERTDVIIQRMHDFYAQHGEPKNQGTRENEASLARWISKQRNNKKKRLNPEMCARVEQEFPWWSWDPLADKLERTITQIHIFYAAHGEPPKQLGIRENESTLATWIRRRREDKTHGTNSDLCARMDLEFSWWSWNPIINATNQTIEELHAFYAAYGEPQKRGLRKNEQTLATWICKRRHDRRNGFNDELCARVQRNFPWLIWDPIISKTLDQTIQDLHSFYAKYVEAPKYRGLRENEKQLAKWISLYRKEKKNGRNIELCVRIEHEFPWLSSDLQADMHEQTFKEMHAFYAAHGVPKQLGLRKNEHKLANWLYSSYRSPERSARVKNEFPWYRCGSHTRRSGDHSNAFQELHAFYEKYAETPKERGQRENEIKMAQWMCSRRTDKRKGRNAALCAKIDIEFPWWCWNPIDENMTQIIQEMHAFYAAHGHPKEGGIHKNETMLAHWIGSRRQDQKCGRSLELCARVKSEFPWISWDPKAESHFKTIQELHAFHASHGDPPQYKGIRDNERKLMKWMNHRREDKKKGLNVELCDRIDREFPWWKWTSRPNDAVEYDSMTRQILTDLLRERGLAVGGTKPTLIDRLRQNDASLVLREQDVFGRVSDELPADPPIPLEEDADDVSASDESGMSSDNESGVITASAEEYEGLSDTDEEAEREDSEEDFAPPTKRPRDDGLDQLSKEELLERLRKKPPRGYTAPNPLAKDQINALFADSLPLSGGVVYFLDHTDFKTAHALDDEVEPSDMVIPQNDRATFEEMRRHPRFGASVVFGDFNDVLRAEARPVRGIYADFTGPVQCGLALVAACAGSVQLVPGAVVGVTITLRDPAGNDSYVNAAVEELSSALSDGLGMESLRDAQGDRVPPIYYGAGAPMVTLFKRKL